jgi:hypothetical protein
MRGGLLSDEAVRELFAAPPDEFVAARDRLVNELKASGRDDEAAAVRKLRRPSVVAWALNVVARDRSDDVAALIEAGAALRRAQRKALSGSGAEELRRATEERRALIVGLTDVAVEAIGERGASHRDAIAGTLDAASIDGELGAKLRDGVLEREARPIAGFGVIEGFELLTGGGGDTATPERKDLETEARDRAREARTAAQRSATAARAATRAGERAHELRNRADRAEAAARDAEAEAKRLADEAKTERKRAERASKATDADRT